MRSRFRWKNRKRLFREILSSGVTIDMSYGEARKKMVQEQLVSRGIKEPRVLAAMAKVPRHLFIVEELQGQAYDNNPLPIGEGQTISQPYMVALMVEALGLKGKELVLEIGTARAMQLQFLRNCVGKSFLWKW